MSFTVSMPAKPGLVASLSVERQSGAETTPDWNMTSSADWTDSSTSSTTSRNDTGSTS